MDQKKYKQIAISFSCLLFLTACNDSTREENLRIKEEALAEREKHWETKESEYQSLLKMRDSLVLADAKKQVTADTIAAVKWPAEIEGEWSSRVVCTESTCSDYVVGDLRTDTWNFSNDSSMLITKVSSNNKPVRTYTGLLDDNGIRLHFSTDSNATKLVEMNITINDIANNKMKGTRTVKIDNKCNATFSVDLTRFSSKTN